MTMITPSYLGETIEYSSLHACRSTLEDPTFRLLKVENVMFPHPYCVTSKHVEYASDHGGGILSEAAIKGAERHGAKCGVRGCNLSYQRHETSLTLFVEVPQHRDLNAVEGLHAYLLSIKEQATSLGIQGFAFPVNTTRELRDG